jgi:hypothetical protein
MAAEERDEEAAPEDPAAGVEERFAPEGGRGAETKLRAFWRITAVQQTAVLFIGSLAYDAGSVA